MTMIVSHQMLFIWQKKVNVCSRNVNFFKQKNIKVNKNGPPMQHVSCINL